MNTNITKRLAELEELLANENPRKDFPTLEDQEDPQFEAIFQRSIKSTWPKFVEMQQRLLQEECGPAKSLLNRVTDLLPKFPVAGIGGAAYAKSSISHKVSRSRLLPFVQEGEMFWFEGMEEDGHNHIVLCGSEARYQACTIRFGETVFPVIHTNGVPIVDMSAGDLDYYILRHEQDAEKWPLPVVLYSTVG